MGWKPPPQFLPQNLLWLSFLLWSESNLQFLNGHGTNGTIHVRKYLSFMFLKAIKITILTIITNIKNLK